MQPIERPPRLQSLAQAAVLGPAGLDDWADIRHLHRLAAEKLVGAFLEDSEAYALRVHVTAQDYAEDLHGQNLTIARLDTFLVGAAGWQPAEDNGKSARLTSVCVNPLFTRIGLGRRLVDAIEHQARTAGFHALSVRSPLASIGLFEHLGYETASFGHQSLLGGTIGDAGSFRSMRTTASMPIAFMRKAI